MTICALLQTLGSAYSVYGVIFEISEINIHEPGHAKNCSFAITNVYSKVFVFASAGIIGYRSIDCTAVLNPFAFVTVLVFTISRQCEYSPAH